MRRAKIDLFLSDEMLRMKNYLALLTLLLLSLFSEAQSNSVQKKVFGTLTDATSKKGLDKATLTLTPRRAGSTIQRAASDSNGAFSFLVTDTGEYSLAITHVGYKEQNLRISFSSSLQIDLGTISMLAGSGTLEEIVIQADRPLIEQKADRLVYNAERDLSTLGGTAADVLRNVPMLTVDPNGNVQLRGSGNIRVLINNKPSSLIAVSVADALRQLPADMIKSVDVITNPGSKYDAEGTAGIINITTKKNMLIGLTGSINIVPGNVSTIGNAGLNFRRPRYGIQFSSGINQFYNTGVSYLSRTDFTSGRKFLQEGTTRNRSGFVSPRVGFDFTLNEKNTISAGMAFNPSFDRVKTAQVVTNSTNGVVDKVSNFDLLNYTKVYGYDYNFEYLRLFKDPLQEFSLLALYSLTSSDNESFQDEYDPFKSLVYQQRNTNKSANKELTFQGDYSQPFSNKTVLEIGAKTIIRNASSDVDYRNIYPSSGGEETSKNVFSYRQNVVAAYLSYGFKLLKRFQVKAGTRFERTTLDAEFKTRSFSFNTDYQNFLPSVNAAYTFKEKHTIRLGYSQRIYRPQLFYLNPYREVLSPKRIRYGNPELDAELAHIYDLNYGTYGTGWSFNMSVYARVTNNALASTISLEQDTTFLRYQNIAKNKTYGAYFSGNHKLFSRWSVNANVNLDYVDLQGFNIRSSGWMYSLFVGSTLNLGKGWTHMFTGSFNSRAVSLQGRRASFYYHNTTLRKELWNRRGSIGINLANPFMKGTRFLTTQVTPEFEQVEDYTNYTRGIRLAFSYRFGTLQQPKAPKKPKKNINNDDALRQ